MSKLQLLALCFCNFVIFTGISGFVGLMPVYLSQLGVDAGAVGGFLALAYLALALSGVIGGQLSNRIGRRKFWLLVCGAAAAPVAWLMGRATTVLPLALLMVALWFVTGIVLSMLNILTGMFSDEGARGRIFGMLSLSAGLGLCFGYLASGQIVNWWGFPALFSCMGAFYLTIPAVGLLIKDRPRVVDGGDAGSGLRIVLANRTFVFLFGASIVGQAANSVIFLSRTLLMNERGFDAAAIATTGAIGSLAGVALPPLVGFLADRSSRKLLLVLCFVATTLGLLGLLMATSAWQFMLVSVLQVVLGVSLVVASAIVTDTFFEDALGTALSLMNATPWIGIVLGLGAGGLAINRLQMVPTLLGTTGVSLVALALLLPVTDARPPAQAGPVGFNEQPAPTSE